MSLSLFSSHFRDLTSPYLPPPLFYEYSKEYHLVICVHGLDGMLSLSQLNRMQLVYYWLNSNLVGNFYDLRLFKTYLTLALPKENLDFLMSGTNQVYI